MAGIGEFPIVLSLEELTGLGRTVDTYLETIQKAMKHNEIEEAKNIIALTTDDLNVMCIVGISCSFCDQCPAWFVMYFRGCIRAGLWV